MRIEGVPASAGYAEGPLFDLDRPPAVYAGKATSAEEKTALEAAIGEYRRRERRFGGLAARTAS